MADLFAVQAALVARLKAAPTTYPVFDAVPQSQAKPYVVIGAWTGFPDEDLEGDPENTTVTLHGWSAQNGKKEAHAIRAWIFSKLNHQPVPGTWALFQEFWEILEETTTEGRLYHLITRYRIRTN